MKIDFTELVAALIGLLSVAITGYLIPLLQKKWGAEKFAEVDRVIGIAVKAAEQYFYSGKGAEKKDFVVKYLKDKGISVDDERIEAKVNELFNHDCRIEPADEDYTAPDDEVEHEI